MRQFFHLRFSLPLRLRLGALLRIALIPANTLVIAEGQHVESSHTYFLLQGEFVVFVTDKTQVTGQLYAASHPDALSICVFLILCLRLPSICVC